MNKSRSIICVVVLLVYSQHMCFGQRIVGARSEMHISIGYNAPLGSKSVNNTPTLMANMKSGYSAEIRYLSLLSKNLYVGGWTGFSKFSGWNTPSSMLFSGTSMTMTYFGPTIMYTTWSAKNIAANHLHFNFSLSPGLNQLQVTTSPDSKINDGDENNPLKVKALRFIVSARAGLNYIITNSLALSCFVGYQYTPANSKIFTDQSYSYLQVGAGLSFRFSKDKKYRYSAL